MTRRITYMMLLLAFMASLLFAFTATYRTDTPSGSDDPSEGDDRIREIKVAVQERLDVDHYWHASGANTYDDPNTGKHRYVRFVEPNDLTDMPANEGALFTKNVNDVAELHWINEQDQIIQLTQEGIINLTSESLLGVLANDTFFTALDEAGTGTVDLIKAGRDEDDGNDVPVLGQGARLPTAADLTEDTELVHKKYVDDRLKRYVKVSDQKFAVGGGEYYTSNTWQSRDLNTEDSDAYNLCTIEDNHVQITLEAGTYYCHIVTPVVYKIPGRGIRCVGTACLYNGTSSVELVRAPNTGFTTTDDGYAGDYPYYVGVNHIITGQFTVADSQKLDVRVISSYAVNESWGLGFRYWEDMSTPNIYTVAEFWKLD